MSKVAKVGRLLFAIAIAGFGLQYLIYATGAPDAAPGPPWIVGSSAWCYAAALVCCGIAIALTNPNLKEFAGQVLAVLLFLHIALFNLPGLLAHWRNPGQWASSFEVLAMAAAALLISRRRRSVLFVLARILFGLTMLVFAMQHFRYANALATLIPHWLPAPLYLVYFTGIAFLAAALSLITGFLSRWAMLGLGVMFLTWVTILHLPRVFASPGNGHEVTSMLVALAIGAGAWAALPANNA